MDEALPVVEAVAKLRVSSVLLDGEGIVCDRSGLAIFDLLHSKKNDAAVSLCALDLIELNGEDLRKLPLLGRKTRLRKILAKSRDGIHYNEHIEGEGAVVFEHACKLGCEGIVAKRKYLPYESGRSKRWLKIKNPDSPAIQRVRDQTF